MALRLKQSLSEPWLRLSCVSNLFIGHNSLCFYAVTPTIRKIIKGIYNHQFRLTWFSTLDFSLATVMAPNQKGKAGNSKTQQGKTEQKSSDETGGTQDVFKNLVKKRSLIFAMTGLKGAGKSTILSKLEIGRAQALGSLIAGTSIQQRVPILHMKLTLAFLKVLRSRT